MGQRLNLEIHKNGEVLANAYYHWSGYTSSALHLTEKILSNISVIKHEDDTILAIKLLELTEAKITRSELEFLKTLNPSIDTTQFDIATNRNDGLIAISEEGVNNTRYWEEARVEIDIGTEMIHMQLYYELDKMDMDERDDIVYQEANMDYTSVSFKDFKTLYNEIISNIERGNYYYTHNNILYGFIE